MDKLSLVKLKLAKVGISPIFILILVNILVGLLLFRGYGSSWDEANHRYYGTYVLNSYSTVFSHGYQLYDAKLPTLKYYGPAFDVSAKIFSLFLYSIFPKIKEEAYWHLAGFLLFQIAVYSVYLIARRWMHETGALISSILFATQPLLWGHAFINPKDAPFMVFFTASIAFGLSMIDQAVVLSSSPWRSFGVMLSEDIDNIPAKKKKGLLLLAAIYLFFSFCLLVGGSVFENFISSGINFFYHSYGDIFHFFASNADSIPPETYIAKAKMLFSLLKPAFIITGFVILLVISFGQLKNINYYFGKLFLAGVFLGLATAMRVLGPYAGVIIIVILLSRLKAKSMPFIVIYGTTAILITYLLWPFLWTNPIGNFLESMEVMSSYPWQGAILFNGAFYSSVSLPYAYLPTLLTLQFTEPIVVFLGLGLILLVYHSFVKKTTFDFLYIVTAWFIIPLAGFILAKKPLYDNFRQLLFILPPIFILAGYAVEFILGYVKRNIFKYALVILLLAPGILGIVKLYPYEYIYYNSFTGGVRGAFRVYELDYWAVSLSEVVAYLNRVAPQEATVIVSTGTPVELVRGYFRKDLKVFAAYEEMRGELNSPFYGVVITRSNYDLNYQPDAEIIYAVKRDGVPLSVVKNLGDNYLP